MNIKKYITEFLQENDKLHLLGIGEFYKHETSAKIDTAEKKIIPSHAEIIFRPVPYNEDFPLTVEYESEFSKFIVKKSGVHRWDVLREIRNYCLTLQRTLNTNGTVEISELGTLKKNADGKIIFQPSPTLSNYDDSNFGMDSIEYRPISRRNSPKGNPTAYSTQTAVLQPKVILPAKSAPRTIIIRESSSTFTNIVSIIALCVSLFSAFFVIHGYFFDNLNQRSLIGKSQHIQHNDTSEILPSAKNESATTTAEKTLALKNIQSVPNEKLVVNNTHENIYIIAGVFCKMSYAQALKEKLRAAGYEPEILPPVKGGNCSSYMYRVACAKTDSKEKALEILSSVKNIIADDNPWLLKLDS